MNDTNTAAVQVGMVVQDRLGGDLFGKVAYITADGWAGVKQPGGRIDEFPLSRLMPDPT